MKTMIICTFLWFVFQLSAQVQPTMDDDSNPATPLPADRLQELLEMSRLLVAVGNYEDAYVYFEYLLRYDQTLELANNAGVTAVLNALSYFRSGEPEVRFHYPLELDAVLPGAKGGLNYQEIRKQLLEKALGYFNNGLRIDPAYAPTHLNNACVIALLGDLDAAEAYLEQKVKPAARQAGFEKTARDADVLLGIVYARRGDEARAQEAFLKAAQQGSMLGAINRAILLKEPLPRDTLPPDLETIDESIDQVTLTDPYNLPEGNLGGRIELSPEISFYRDLNATSHARFYFNENTGTSFQTYFLLTQPGYTGETVKKVRLGDTITQIESAYGRPDRLLDTAQGQILYYSARGILFLLEVDGKLIQWAIVGNRSI